MTAGLSIANLANKWLNVIRGGGNGQTFTAPAAITAKLHVGVPGDDGTSNYCAGDTSAQAVTFAAASASVAGAIQLSNTPSWENVSTNETITHISLWDTTTFLASGQLTAQKEWSDTDTLTLTALQVGLSPLAAD